MAEAYHFDTNNYIDTHPAVVAARADVDAFKARNPEYAAAMDATYSSTREYKHAVAGFADEVKDEFGELLGAVVKAKQQALDARDAEHAGHQDPECVLCRIIVRRARMRTRQATKREGEL